MITLIKIILILIGAGIGAGLGVILFHTQKHPYGLSGAPSISKIGGAEDWRTKWGAITGAFIGFAFVYLWIRDSNRR